MPVFKPASAAVTVTLPPPLLLVLLVLLLVVWRHHVTRLAAMVGMLRPQARTEVAAARLGVSLYQPLLLLHK